MYIFVFIFYLIVLWCNKYTVEYNILPINNKKTLSTYATRKITDGKKMINKEVVYMN